MEKLVQNNPNLTKLCFNGFRYMPTAFYVLNDKCLEHLAYFCHNLEYFTFVCKPRNHDGTDEDEEFDRRISHDLTNVLYDNKILKVFNVSHDIVDYTMLSELGTYCPLLQSLTVVGVNKHSYLLTNFEHIKGVTEGCRSLKYLDIQAMSDCQNDFLTLRGTNNQLLEVLRLMEDVDFGEIDIESSSFQSLFKGCPLLKDITLTKFDILPQSFENAKVELLEFIDCNISIETYIKDLKLLNLNRCFANPMTDLDMTKLIDTNGESLEIIELRSNKVDAFKKN